ncbi:MAG: hypothetical protein JZU64_11185, partial [Rhodoferax sp.]|nr:hypothetical protein [Rhodoferax sp.]
MENETVNQKQTLPTAMDQGRVSQALVAADGTITVGGSRGKLQSVDVADVDLVLGFADGSSVIIPSGAMSAISESPPSVHFVDGRASLAALFKMVGSTSPAKGGSLRVLSEKVEGENPSAEEEREAAADDSLSADLPAPPAPLIKESTEKWAVLDDIGEGDVEVQALATPHTAVYRVGTKKQISFGQVLEDLGLGDQPTFTQTLYTSTEFKLNPSGRTDLPAGSFDSGLTSAQKAEHASPAGQASREAILGTSGNDSIDHNPAFSAASSQWSKTLHLDFNNFSSISSIQLVFEASKMALIPGFDIQGAGVSRTAPNSNAWNITPSADVFRYGQDVQIVYTISSDTVTPVDFGADITVAGVIGPLQFELTNNFTLTWRDAITESDFAVFDETGAPMMVLPSSGLGVDVYAGAGDDRVSAGAGNDIVHGETGNDSLYGGFGNDLLDGGAGGDVLDGGQGLDTATYINAAEQVTAIFDASGTGLANTGEAAGDSYASVENLTGSAFSDVLIGDSEANILTGGQGDDTLMGRANGDTLDGGAGTDTASYANAANGVTVSLTSNTGTLGEANGDTLLSIENLIGGRGNDTFTGAAGIQANAFDGGSGSDTVSYGPSSAGVVATLTAGLVAQTNEALGDTYTSIENLTGSFSDDVLIGDGSIN